MECTSPRYVSIPSEVQTCYTLEEKNTFRVAAVKRYMPCSPDDYINFFFIQGQVIYNILMPQASIRASQIVRLEESMESTMEQWTYTVAANLVLLSVSWTTLCISRAVTSPQSFMCKYSNANTHASIYKHGTIATLTIRCFCYCNPVKPRDLRTKGSQVSQDSNDA